jgi:Flp pilus assembly protein TadG
MFKFLDKRFTCLPLRDQRGGAMIEFGFAMPLLILLFMGGLELGRYVLLHAKLDRTAMTVSDLVARVTSLSEAELDTIFAATDLVMAPFSLGDRGVVVVSSVTADTGTGTPTVTWQRSGAGTLTVTSDVGALGDDAVIPDPAMVSVTSGGVIVGETYFDYSPWLIDIIPSVRLHHVAIFRPRLNGAVICTDCPSPP